MDLPTPITSETPIPPPPCPLAHLPESQLQYLPLLARLSDVPFVCGQLFGAMMSWLGDEFSVGDVVRMIQAEIPPPSPSTNFFSNLTLYTMVVDSPGWFEIPSPGLLHVCFPAQLPIPFDVPHDLKVTSDASRVVSLRKIKIRPGSLKIYFDDFPFT